MKTIIQKIAIFVCLCTILCLFSSFITREKENNLKLRNIEVLSRGEDNPKSKCDEDDGFCIDNDGIAYYGMRVKIEK
ncbi:hypothetical protein AAAX96_13780 [Butyricimonas faecihominis]|uniref:hypothetical protein n=1 Tax=Butyricimonas faecihominis TaxID=1472416 RepID=UPI0032BFA202